VALSALPSDSESSGPFLPLARVTAYNIAKRINRRRAAKDMGEREIMKTSRQLFIVLNMILFSFMSSGGVAAAEAEIWQKLAGGGLVVFMRHTATNTVKGSGNPLVRDPTCRQERKLSPKGKRQAAQIGKMFTAFGVPVGDVLVSPYCRTTDTAEIAFGRGTPTDFLSLLEVLSAEQADAATERLNRRIGSHSGKDNLVLVSHGPNIDTVSFDPVAMGAFVVFKPTGKDTFEEIGIINIAD
jgi:phosphohistidine phosphatase SixA